MNNHKAPYQKHILVHGLEVDLNSLRRSLTHYSYYDDKTHKNCNSRDIFLGMYAFKGYVASLMEQFVPGHGNDLQHILGQLFKKPQLERLFDELGLEELVRAGDGFAILENKHLFVFGYFGLLYQNMDGDRLDSWIFQRFFQNFEHLFNHRKQWDVISQSIMILRQKLGTKPQFEMGEGEKKQYKAKIKVNDKNIVTVESNSRKYIRKQAYKKAMLKVIEGNKQAGVV